MTPIGMFWNKNLKTDQAVFEKTGTKVKNCAFFDENGGHFENNADIEKQKKTLLVFF